MSFSNTDQPKDGAEPSMEEILASIRRILKDEAVKSPAGDLDDDVLVLDSSMVAKPVDLSTATSPPAASLPTTESPATPLQSTASPVHFTSAPTLISPVYTPPASAEPELVLTPAPEPAAEPEAEPPAAATPPSIFTTGAAITEAEAPVFKPAGLAPPPVAPVFGGRSLQDFPVLKPESEAPVHATDTPLAATPAATFEPAATPFYAAPAPISAPEPAPVAERAPEPVPEPAASTLIAPAPSPAQQPPSETKMPETQDNLTPPTSLVSDQVSAAAANSIGAMLRSMTAEKSVAISRQSLTIEDMVREEIRPLLKAWLDTNLAGMVERVVRAEIEKVMERSAG